MRNIIESEKLIWVDISKPEEEDINYLKSFNLHPVTLKNIIPFIYHPDIDIFKKYVSLTIHYPLPEDDGDTQIQELDIIFGKNFFITNHYEKILPLNDLFEQCFRHENKRKEYMDKGIPFLLFSLLNNILKEKLLIGDKLSNEIDAIEKGIFLGKEKENLKEISRLKRKIIDFWKIIEPQKAIFESLKIVGVNFFGKEFMPYFSSLSRCHRRVESVLSTSKEIAESLEETNHILVTLKLNEIIKILTIFSAVLLPLTLLASIWGMNTNFLPFSNTSIDFWMIMGIMVIVLLSMLIYFRIKKWL